MADADEYVSLERDVTMLIDRLFGSGTVAGTLRQIVDLAEEAVDGCDAAGVLVVDDDDRASTLATSNERAAELDRLQVDADEGPCLDAARRGTTFYAEDLADDDRWTTFAPQAVAAGTRSVLAYSLSAQRMSALNLYASLPAAFGALDRAKGQLFATLARHALDAAQVSDEERFRTLGLTEALRTRELIGQAQGILMERERISAEQAFDVLRRASQHLNIKLREVAARLVETGELPEVGKARAGD